MSFFQDTYFLWTFKIFSLEMEARIKPEYSYMSSKCPKTQFNQIHLSPFSFTNIFASMDFKLFFATTWIFDSIFCKFLEVLSHMADRTPLKSIHSSDWSCSSQIHLNLHCCGTTLLPTSLWPFPWILWMVYQYVSVTRKWQKTLVELLKVLSAMQRRWAEP